MLLVIPLEQTSVYTGCVLKHGSMGCCSERLPCNIEVWGFICVWVFSLCVCAPHGCLVSRPEQGVSYFGTEVPDGCELPCGSWGLNPCPRRIASAPIHCAFQCWVFKRQRQIKMFYFFLIIIYLTSKSIVTILIVKRSEVFSTWKLTFACLECFTWTVSLQQNPHLLTRGASLSFNSILCMSL